MRSMFGRQLGRGTTTTRIKMRICLFVSRITERSHILSHVWSKYYSSSVNICWLLTLCSTRTRIASYTKTFPSNLPRAIKYKFMKFAIIKLLISEALGEIKAAVSCSFENLFLYARIILLLNGWVIRKFSGAPEDARKHNSINRTFVRSSAVREDVTKRKIEFASNRAAVMACTTVSANWNFNWLAGACRYNSFCWIHNFTVWLKAKM